MNKTKKTLLGFGLLLVLQISACGNGVSSEQNQLLKEAMQDFATYQRETFPNFEISDWIITSHCEDPLSEADKANSITERHCFVIMYSYRNSANERWQMSTLLPAGVILYKEKGEWYRKNRFPAGIAAYIGFTGECACLQTNSQ